MNPGIQAVQAPSRGGPLETLLPRSSAGMSSARGAGGLLLMNLGPWGLQADGLSKDLGVISRPPRSLIALGVSRLVDSLQTPLLLTCAPEGSVLPGASAAPGTLSKDLRPRASPLLLGLLLRTSGPRASVLAPRVSAAPRTLSKDLQPLDVSSGPRGLCCSWDSTPGGRTQLLKE